MANRQFPFTPALKPFQMADDAWTGELHRVFGKRSGEARYTDLGRGEEGTILRRLYEEREKARAAWHRTAY